MNEKARYIRERFPDKIQTMDLLLAEDPEFLDLCEDHDACVDALQHWSTSKAPEAESRVNEYLTLIGELRNEISQILASSKHQRLY